MRINTTLFMSTLPYLCQPYLMPALPYMNTTVCQHYFMAMWLGTICQHYFMAMWLGTNTILYQHGYCCIGLLLRAAKMSAG